MNNIDLTIAIPIYNGSRWIGSAIDSILSQLHGDSRGKVEIVISDNASTDQSPGIIEEYAKQYPEIISYFSQVENIGADRNVDSLFHFAKETYVMVLGDVGLIENGAIEKLLSTLKSNPPGLYLCAPQFLNTETDELHAPHSYSTDNVTLGG